MIVSSYQRLLSEDHSYRDISSESMTVPDQSMSIKDIINRSLAGLPTIGRQDAFFDEEEDADPVDGYDLSDVDPEKLPEYERSQAAEKRFLGED